MPDEKQPEDKTFDPEVYVAALKRERASIEPKPYSGAGGKDLKARRLKEIDDELAQYDKGAGQRERAVNK